eukprot:scpid50345/ scgid0241/ Probable peptidyl-tRNA hydrolase 2
MSFQDESGSNGAAMPTEAEGESSLAAVHSASEVPPVSAASQDVYSNGVSVHAAQPRRPFSPMAGRCTEVSLAETISAVRAIASIAPPVAWEPNGVHLEGLVNMGVSRNAAVKALYATGNAVADEALSWVIEHVDDPDLNDEPNIAGYFPEAAVAPVMPMEVDTYKMVLVVNMSLKMGTGKIVSQTGHAVLALYSAMRDMGSPIDNWLAAWESRGSKKIAVRAQDTAALQALLAKAHALLLPSLLISDAGRTQVPAGSTTIMVVFGPSAQVDAVTGHLKLL